MKLWETRMELGEVKNIEAWCMTLTRNKSLDAIKRAGRKLSDSLDHTHDSNHSTNYTPLEVVSDKESMDQVRLVTNKLPEKQKTAFTLREIQGFSYLEISDIMKINMNQVKVNIHRARTAIREELTKIYSYES